MGAVEPCIAAAGRHEVVNQPPQLDGYDTFLNDVALVEGVRREGADWAEPWLSEIGCVAGSAQAIEWGFLANTYPPVLRTHDRYGHRIDEVTFHPAWHELLGQAVRWGLHAGPWRDLRPGAHVAHIAAFSLCSQAAGDTSVDCEAAPRGGDMRRRSATYRRGAVPPYLPVPAGADCPDKKVASASANPPCAAS